MGFPSDDGAKVDTTTETETATDRPRAAAPEMGALLYGSLWSGASTT
ncbi:hypothetical protein [Leptothoe sp. PORK10 BA2]|nr:hypothetical protein [Leptothoe sp. PORK10 BA2]MEA5466757.1 hypothetical protein [Leptothoe sp. PORK10 BA2]